MQVIVRKIPKIFLFLFVAGLIGYLCAIVDVNGIFTSGQYPIKESIIVVLLSGAMSVVLAKIKDISRILLVGLWIRIFLSLLIGYLGILPYAFDTQWDIVSAQLYQDWNSGNFHLDFEASGNTRYYTYFTALVYLLLGYNPVFMQLVNAFFGALTILMVYKIADKLFNPKAAKTSAWIMALFPSHIMFSAMHMRDSLSTLLMSAFLYQFIAWRVHVKTRNLMMYAFYFVLNSLIRAQNAVLLLVVTTPMIYRSVLKKSHPYLRPIIFMGFISFVAAVCWVVYSAGYFQYASIEYLSKEMEYRSDGGAQYLTWMSYGSWLDVLLYAPLRCVYFMFSPFPWDVSTPSQVIAAAENLFLWIMTFTVLKNWRKLRGNTTNKSVLAAVVIIFLVGTVANAVVDGNSGTALRHKLQYIYILIVLFAATKATSEKR